jgi:DNA-binding response OmpR family regulator
MEDDYLQASDLADLVRAERGHLIGPVPSLDKGLEIISRAEAIDCAILDIKLGDQLVYPLVERLRQRSTPVIFVSGCDRSVIPENFAGIPLCQKPVRVEELRELMVRVLGRS